MNNVLSSGLVIAGVAGIILFILYMYGEILRRRKQRASSPPRALRSPGQSLQTHIERLDVAVRFSVTALLAGACLFPVGHLALSYLGNMPESLERIVVSAGGGALFLVFFLWRWARLAGRRRIYRLGLEGDMAVGRALNPFTEEGFHVYHDFPAQPSIISHIVIGPVGIMTVETKARSIDTARRSTGDPIVEYDGRMLHFPKDSDYQTIDHAKELADWLSGWLYETVGDHISVRAIVAVPGWHVKRTSADGIPVVNPKQFPTLFEHIKPHPLSRDTIQHICRRIEQQYHETIES